MEEDHVVEELDVYAFVDSGPQEHLFLLQYPTITKSSHIYHEILGACPRTSMQMKPEAKIMEIDFPLAMMNDTGNFDIAKAREFSAMPPDDRSSSSNKKQEKDHLDTLKFSSSHLPHASIQPVMGLCVDSNLCCCCIFHELICFCCCCCRQNNFRADQGWNPTNAAVSESFTASIATRNSQCTGSVN